MADSALSPAERAFLQALEELGQATGRVSLICNRAPSLITFPSMTARSALSRAKRIVVKIGSRALAAEAGLISSLAVEFAELDDGKRSSSFELKRPNVAIDGAAVAGKEDESSVW